MATDDNNIKHFSAADIERYHKGQLSAKQMHDMEKAAMDDPFLADALEGYSAAGVNVSADMTDLKKRLAERTGSAKVVPIESPKRSFQFLRVAVMLLFIAGAGLLIYQFGFNNKEKPDIAQVNQKNINSVPTDTSAPAPRSSGGDTITNTGEGSGTTVTIKAPLSTVTSPENTKGDVSTGNLSTIDPAKEKPGVTEGFKNIDRTIAKTSEPQPVYVAPPGGNVREKDNNIAAEDKFSNKPVSRAIDDVKIKQKDDGRLKDEEERAEQAYRKMNAGKNQRQDNAGTLGANTFRGQVTDNNRVGVPFANVTNPIDGVGTYTDARGYFNLTYPDSVLNVQVRSIGFENTNVQLRNAVPSNQVVLDNDQTSLSEVVVSKQKINAAARSRDNTMKLEEPEPADGWEKYDAYLLNNNSLQDETKNTDKSNGTVMLSFDVNKNGEPTNIKVEKSLCKDCDKEAIRLLKEGPKWKRNAKKGRATIAVPF